MIESHRGKKLGLRARFMARMAEAERTPEGCLLWPSTKLRRYGAMQAKGRRGRPIATGLDGERNGSAKLTDSQALQIVSAWFGGMTTRQAALEFGVSQATISGVLTGRAFASVTGMAPGENHGGRRAAGKE